jgi:hypothetical protein
VQLGVIGSGNHPDPPGGRVEGVKGYADLHPFIVSGPPPRNIGQLADVV